MAALWAARGMVSLTIAATLKAVGIILSISLLIAPVLLRYS
ncbi:metal ABC transporter permease [Shigella flexneri]